MFHQFNGMTAHKVKEQAEQKGRKLSLRTAILKKDGDLIQVHQTPIEQLTKKNTFKMGKE